jgi:hypothetical protein
MLFTDPTVPNAAVDAFGVRQFQSTTGDAVDPTWDDTITNTPTNQLDRRVRRQVPETPTLGYTNEIGPAGQTIRVNVPNPKYADAQLISPGEANAEFGLTLEGKVHLQ